MSEAIQKLIRTMGQELKTIYGDANVEIHIDEPQLPYDGIAIMNNADERKLDIYWCNDDGDDAGQWMYEMARFDSKTNDMTMIGPDPLDMYVRSTGGHGEPPVQVSMATSNAIEYATLFGFLPEPKIPGQIDGAPDFPEFVSNCLTEWTGKDLREELVGLILDDQKLIDGWNKSYQETFGGKDEQRD